MTDRLLLGSSPLLPVVAERLSSLPGTLRVGTTDEALAGTLQDSGITVSTHDALDAETLRTLDEPEIIAVFEETPQATTTRCEVVREVFSDVYLLAYTGTETTGPETSSADHDPSRQDDIERVADKVLDPTSVTARHIVRRVGEQSRQSRELLQVLRDIDNLAIVTHDNPDPDAIASGLALACIASAAGSTSDICYFGDITHQENRALVNVLNLDLKGVEEGETFEEYDGIALVDHSRPGVNDQLSQDTPVDIVIDHHPPRSPIDARFVDLRSDVGATSTLLVDYLDRFGVELETDLATALLFGIHVDTDGFSREVSQRDFEAAARLVPTVDFGTLERIETPNMSPTTLETIASAITRRQIEGQVLLSGVGKLHERDALAQASDRLLALEGVTTTLVYGVKDGTIFVSARARGADIDLGETLREAFDQIGSAGGHVDMAGAQIQLGVLEAVDDESTSLYDIVDDVVVSRFLDVLETQTTYQVEGVYHTDAEASAEYLAGDEVESLTDTDADGEGDNGAGREGDNGTDESADRESADGADGEAPPDDRELPPEDA